MVSRIKLIVTGDMEKHSLADSLRRHFPSVDVNGQDVVWEKPRKLQCATSHPLDPAATSASNPMEELARAMIDEAIDGKTVPADLVIAIDDVEIANLGQEAVIGQHFRMACRQALGKKASSQQTLARYTSIVQQKCSFHVLRPMVESYLFGDLAALAAAGVGAAVTPALRSPDVEQFESVDVAWLTLCQQVNGQMQSKHPWWREEWHPKRYLEHLVVRSGGTYDETQQGKLALLGLQWNGVPKQQTDTPFARALFEDVADWFGVPNPLGAGAMSPHFYPPIAVNRQTLLLRNQ